MASLTNAILDNANPSSVTGTGRLDNSLREALSNRISNITRQDTPFKSSLGTEKTTRETFDWLTDQDAAPVDNNQSQGSQFSSPTETGRTRLYNYTAIRTKFIDVSDTSIASDTAGISSEYKYQMMKRARELKKDDERGLLAYPVQGTGTDQLTFASNAFSDDQDSHDSLSRVVKRAYDGSNAAVTGSVWSWVRNFETASTDDVRIISQNSDGDGIDVSGTGSTGISSNTNANGSSIVADGAAATSLSRAKVNSILQKIYEAGQGNPTMAMCSPALKISFSEVYSNSETIANDIRRLNAMEKMINTAITKITTDFGFVIGLVPNWIMTDTHGSDGSSVLFYEPSMMKICVLRPYSEKPLGQEGDNTRGMVRYEAGLKVMNPLAHGVILNVS